MEGGNEPLVGQNKSFVGESPGEFFQVDEFVNFFAVGKDSPHPLTRFSIHNTIFEEARG